MVARFHLGGPCLPIGDSYGSFKLQINLLKTGMARISFPHIISVSDELLGLIAEFWNEIFPYPCGDVMPRGS